MNTRGKKILTLAISKNEDIKEPIFSESEEEPFQDSGSEYCPSDLGSSCPEYSPTFESVREQIIIDSPKSEEMDFHNRIDSLEYEIQKDTEKQKVDENMLREVPSATPLNEITDTLESETKKRTSSSNQIGLKRRKMTKGKEKTKRIRRKHTCKFCDMEVTNYSRHMERHHTDELQVQEFMSLPKNSKQRKKLIDKLRREGDFITTEIIPVMKVNDVHSENYIVCKFCSGYYTAKSLRRHTKRCFFNPDPSKPLRSQVEGQTKMAGYYGPNDILKTSGLLNNLRADKISFVAKKDFIICEVARRYIKSHKEKHLLLVAKRYMRRLARLLIGVRNLKNDQSLKMLDILTPDKFKALVKATQDAAEYDPIKRVFKSPSFALQMGTLIKHAINAAYSLEIQKPNPIKDRLEKLKCLTTLIETDWAQEVSSEAGQNLAINKFNKPTLIPLAKDIKKFETYLKGVIATTRHSLVDNSSDLQAFRKLVETVFCSVLIFNKRRVGELQRMTLLAFLKNYETSSSSEFEKALTNSEKILYKKLKRVVIRGKRGRGAPVLFDKDTVEALEFLITVRKNFDLENNPYLFGVPGTDNPLTGNAVMRKHAKFALGDVTKASLLTSTRLRKHLATITQIFRMEKTELEQLATFMGHTHKTHSEFYRLPDDVYQTAKISKLLLLSKEQGLEKYKGKSLEEIELDDEVMEENVSDEEENDENADLDYGERNDDQPNRSSDKNVAELNALPSTSARANSNIKKGAKRTLVPWTETQKKLTEAFFKKHIKNRIPPKKNEVLTLIEQNPEIFSNKTWPKIKVFVCNKFKK